MNISPRNSPKGKVKTVVHGSVTAEVIIELPGGIDVVSIITKDTARRPGLSPGKGVYAVVKAGDVPVATD